MPATVKGRLERERPLIGAPEPRAASHRLRRTPPYERKIPLYSAGAFFSGIPGLIMMDTLGIIMRKWVNQF